MFSAPENQFKADLLACPFCFADLKSEDGGIRCNSCNRRFLVFGGVPCFSPTENFYDNYARDHCPYAVSPAGLKSVILRFLPFWSWREWQFWNRTVPFCGRLLDIGCGRGREIFRQRATEIVGFDSSLAFAQDCAAYYDTVAVGTLPRLPFSSNSFDAVVSSHVMGHVAIEEKETLVAEIARTLRLGGISGHIIETDSNHPIVATAKKHPETYRRQFVEQDGHIGLEPASLILDRFARHGLALKRLRLVDAIIPSLQNFRKYLDHPDFSEAPGVSRLRRINQWTINSRIANAVYEVGMGAFHRTVEQWIGKPDRAQFILISFIKTANTRIKAL